MNGEHVVQEETTRERKNRLQRERRQCERAIVIANRELEQVRVQEETTRERKTRLQRERRQHDRSTVAADSDLEQVIAGVIESLNLRIPPYVRVDLIQISVTQALSADKKFINWMLRVTSVHGSKAALPFIKSIEVSFQDGVRLGYKEAILQTHPFKLKRRTSQAKEFDLVLKLNFSGGCGCTSAQIKIPVGYKVPDPADHLSGTDKDEKVEYLKDSAIQKAICGKSDIIERKFLTPNTELTTHAIVTNVVSFSKSSPEAESGSNGDLMQKIKLGIWGNHLCWKRKSSRKRNRKQDDC